MGFVQVPDRQAHERLQEAHLAVVKMVDDLGEIVADLNVRLKEVESALEEIREALRGIEPEPEPEPEPDPEPEPEPEPEPDPPPVRRGVWISKEEVMARPTNGAAWERMVAAVATDPVELLDQDSKSDTSLLAAALKAVRVADPDLAINCLTALEKTMGREKKAGDDATPFSRQTLCLPIVADLVGGATVDGFDAWLTSLLDFEMDSRSDRKTLWVMSGTRLNNVGLHALASCSAIGAYLGSQERLDRCAEILRYWTGELDPAEYPGAWKWRYLNRGWQPDPEHPWWVLPVGSRIDGEDVSGAIAEDAARAGKYPEFHANYSREALQGAFNTAIVLYRSGYNVAEWGDRALLRAVRFVERRGAKFSGDDENTMWLAKHLYPEEEFRLREDARPGKAMAWSAWTHHG